MSVFALALIKITSECCRTDASRKNRAPAGRSIPIHVFRRHSR
jgi:hypothetical protein